MEKEQFRPIEGYAGYFISDQGRVMSTRRKSGPHILSQRSTKSGYREVMISVKCNLVTLYVARLVLAAFEGYPADPWLCYAHHLNGDMSDCRLENLEWIVCETTDEYDPNVSKRRGVLKPDITREKMSQAKFNQSEETIEKQRLTKMRRYGIGRRNYE